MNFQNPAVVCSKEGVSPWKYCAEENGQRAASYLESPARFAPLGAQASYAALQPSPNGPTCSIRDRHLCRGSKNISVFISGT